MTDVRNKRVTVAGLGRFGGGILYARRDKRYADHCGGDWQRCVEQATLDMKADLAAVLEAGVSTRRRRPVIAARGRGRGGA